MKFKIYCIIDINGLKYVGKTYRTFKQRLTEHKSKKDCSSKLLDLDNCKMILLCECDKCDVQDREQYFKDNIKCVNILNPVCIFDIKKYMKEWRIKNKEHRKEYERQYNKTENRKQQNADYNLFRSRKVVNGSYNFIKMLEQY